MDHIRNIQETIDENREAIPTGVPVYYLDFTSLYPATGVTTGQIRLFGPSVAKKNRNIMDHIRNIQETIDENREAIPTGVVAEVMRECQQAYTKLAREE